MTGEFALKIWAEAQRTNRNGFRIEGQGCMYHSWYYSPLARLRHEIPISIERGTSIEEGNLNRAIGL